MKKRLIRAFGLLAVCLCLSVCGAAVYAQGVGSIKVEKTTPARPKPAPPRPKPAPKVISRVEAAPVRRPVAKPKPKPGGGKSNEELADEALTKAKELRKDGNNEEAIPYLQKAARLDPKDYESRALLGFIYADQDDLDNGLLWANRAVQADSSAYYSHVSLGWVQYKRKSFAEAENAYRTSLRIAEQYATGAVSGVSYELARTLSELRRYRETLPLLDKSIQSDPKDYNTRFFYGVMLQKVGQLNQAVAQYREASAINPQESAPHSNSGLVYYLLGNNAQAQQTWEKAIELGSTYVPDNAGLAILRCDLGQARQLLEKYTAENSADEDGWLLLGDVLRAQRDDSNARMADARAAAIAPEYSGMRRPVLRCDNKNAINNSNPARPNAEACKAAKQLNENGATTLMLASAQNRTDLIPTILACGIDANAGDKDGDTALTYAVASDNDQVFDMLVKAGARLNAKNKKGVTPLMIAAALGKETSARALLTRGADPKAKDADGDDAMYYAREKKQDRILAMLQNPPRATSGTTPNNNSGDCAAARVVNAKGVNMLMTAAAQGKAELIPTILACGVNPNDGDEDGDTALLYASAADDSKSIELLLQAGARLNGANKKGVTPIIMAAALGKENAVKTLIARGADLKAKAQNGYTALDYAREKKFDRIAAMLQKADW